MFVIFHGSKEGEPDPDLTTEELKILPCRLESGCVTCVHLVGLLQTGHLNKDLQELEKTQYRACRFVKDDYGATNSVKQMLQQLGWQPMTC